MSTFIIRLQIAAKSPAAKRPSVVEIMEAEKFAAIIRPPPQNRKRLLSLLPMPP